MLGYTHHEADQHAVALLSGRGRGVPPGPGPHSQGGVGGTVAGIVSTTTKAAVPDRKATAVNVTTGARFDATTGPNGGYTIKVPEGTYRLEVELRPGETVAEIARRKRKSTSRISISSYCAFNHRRQELRAGSWQAAQSIPGTGLADRDITNWLTRYPVLQSDIALAHGRRVKSQQKHPAAWHIS